MWALIALAKTRPLSAEELALLQRYFLSLAHQDLRVLKSER
jgi:hypothetical protein